MLRLENDSESLVSDTGNGPLHGSSFAKILKRIAKENGIDPKRISNHSIRIGGTIQLMAAGFGEAVIQLVGRWKSFCYKVYLRLVPGLAEDIACKILCK